MSKLSVTRCNPAARRASPCSANKTPLVVSARSRIRGLAAKHSNQLRKIAAQQRLAPREAHVFDAQRGKHLHQPRNFLESQQFLPRQPDVLLLRHAVVAAQVAPVGHRDAQAAQRPAKPVGERAARRHVHRSLRIGKHNSMLVPRAGASTTRIIVDEAVLKRAGEGRKTRGSHR